MIFGCEDVNTNKIENLIIQTSETEKTKDVEMDRLKEISDFPIITDTTKFISSLRKVFNLEVDESLYQKEHEKISVYKKVKIYGSDNDYIFIEYDYGNGSGVAYPWKYQLILNTEGKLVKILSKQRYEFIEIFKNQNPFLLTLESTSKGNGGHELYKITADTLENIYEMDFDYYIRTYDAHQDNTINEPFELVLNIKDYNNDGFNDISFNGNVVFIQAKTKNGDWYDGETIDGKIVNYSIDNPFKKIPIELIFLYDKKSGHFKSKENYSKKYKSLK